MADGSKPKPNKIRSSGRKRSGGGKKADAPKSMQSLPISLGAHGYGGNLIQVEVSVLHPQINFKTLSVAPTTTVYEVICILVKKHAIEMLDQNPGPFFLKECIENSQGCYTQIVGEKELVLEIQNRWKEGDVGHFQLCKQTTNGNCDEDDSSVEGNNVRLSDLSQQDVLHATVVSPGELAEQTDASSREDSPLMSPNRLSSTTRNSMSPLNRMIHESAAEGLSGVMSKVVNEIDQATGRRTSRGRSDTPPRGWERSSQKSPETPNSSVPVSPHDFCRKSPLLMQHRKEVAIVKPLEYSPSVSAKREFPEFVFAGAADGSDTENHNSVSPESEGRAGNRPVSGCSVSSTDSKHSLQQQTVFTPQATSPTDTRTVQVHQLSSINIYEAQEFTSEMNLLDSLAPLINSMPYIVETESLEPTDEEVPATTELISPARKSKLLDEASVQLKELRQYSNSAVNLSSDQCQLAPRSSTLPSLISTARRQRMVNNASVIVQSKQLARPKSTAEAAASSDPELHQTHIGASAPTLS